MLQPLGRWPNVWPSKSPRCFPMRTSIFALEIANGSCLERHICAQAPQRMVRLARKTIRANSKVFDAPLAQIVLIPPIQSATEEMAAPAPATALLVRSVLSALLIPLHGG